jgi:hypothetical protein
VVAGGRRVGEDTDRECAEGRGRGRVDDPGRARTWRRTTVGAADKVRAGDDDAEEPTSVEGGSMTAAIVNVVLGLLCIVGGASGRLVLLGTGSSGALAVAGLLLTAWGIHQIWRRGAR